ncbi:MAG: AraC family transcriptional regulator [Propionicimonas sp.]
MQVRAVERVRDRLTEDLSAQLSLTELAAGVGLSPSYLTAVFKAHTGYSPMQYRTLLRMQRARELLDTSDRSIAEVAREVGYDDVAYFSRRFSSLHELGPRAYRRSGRA